MLRRESKAGDCPNASVETSHPSVLLSAVHYKSNL
ncbi:hypothetical protein T02_8377, partial [Trichinella nativa]